jgi:hypothetical protein
MIAQMASGLLAGLATNHRLAGPPGAAGDPSSYSPEGGDSIPSRRTVPELGPDSGGIGNPGLRVPVGHDTAA